MVAVVVAVCANQRLHHHISCPGCWSRDPRLKTLLLMTASSCRVRSQSVGERPHDCDERRRGCGAGERPCETAALSALICCHPRCLFPPSRLHLRVHCRCPYCDGDGVGRRSAGSGRCPRCGCCCCRCRCRHVSRHCPGWSACPVSWCWTRDVSDVPQTLCKSSVVDQTERKQDPVSCLCCPSSSTTD